MKSAILLSTAVCLFISSFALADTFGTGSNEFNIDFVSISGDASSANGTNIGTNRPEGFVDPSSDYRMGKFEVTNDQWDKFQDAYGAVAGSPANAYGRTSYFTGTNVPTNELSWYAAAQFVNWLNTSTGNPAAYKFTGTQGTVDYTLGVWESGDTGYNPSNPYRNSNAIYFLPTEDEWVKAAYWNGTTLQQYATKPGESLIQGDGTSGVGWNFYDWDNGYATDPVGPWDVGSGSRELNGTYDMMGNVWEWMESPYYSGDYLSGSERIILGGAYDAIDNYLRSSNTRYAIGPDTGDLSLGFRVVSVPEPTTLLLLGMGGLLIRKRK